LAFVVSALDSTLTLFESMIFFYCTVHFSIFPFNAKRFLYVNVEIKNILCTVSIKPSIVFFNPNSRNTQKTTTKTEDTQTENLHFHVSRL